MIKIMCLSAVSPWRRLVLGRNRICYDEIEIGFLLDAVIVDEIEFVREEPLLTLGVGGRN